MSFPWGQIIKEFTLDFDGEVMSVTKYHPKVYANGASTRAIDETAVEYHCAEISRSDSSLYALLLYWLATKQLGLNQGPLVVGICRALQINASL